MIKRRQAADRHPHHPTTKQHLLINTLFSDIGFSGLRTTVYAL